MQLHMGEDSYKFIQDKIGNMKYYEIFSNCPHVLQREFFFLMRAEKDTFVILEG